MTYEIYRYIFLGGAILAGIMFALSVILFFLLRIPDVIGDLSGSNARKAIKKIKQDSQKREEEAHRGSKNKGMITTDKLSTLRRNSKSASRGGETTESCGTESLSPRDSMSETAAAIPVAPEYDPITSGPPDESSEFVIEYQITYIHTDEVIP